MRKVLGGALAGLLAMTLTVSGAFSAATVNAAQPELAEYDSLVSLDTQELTEVQEITEVQEQELTETELAQEGLTVTYEAEEADVTGIPVDTKLYEIGDSVTVSEEVPHRDGYDFMGWSPVGDGSRIYTGGYSFTIEEDTTLTAIWESDEESFYPIEEDAEEAELLGISAKEQQVINAVDNYVNSLDGGWLPYDYYANGKWKSNTCCAVVDYIWEAVYGHSRRQKDDMFKRINSAGKLKGAEIAQFFSDNGATAGDIIWCHDPKKTDDNYTITHYMILLAYDENGITITDGHAVNDHNEIWCNHSTIEWDDTKKNHNKYFNGSCFVSLYHVNEDEEVVGDTSGPVGPTPTPAPTPGDYSGKCGDNLTWNMKSTEKDPYSYKLTISGTGPMYDYTYYDKDGNIAIPWEAKLKSLRGSNYRFESVTFEEGITRIGNCAFKFFAPTVNKITLPESLQEIGDNAFDTCKISGQIKFPDKLSKIGEGAFAYSEFTGALDLSHVKKLGDAAFKDTNFTSVTFGSGLTEIPENCFSYCQKLGGTITLPEGLLTVGSRAFYFYEKNTTERKLQLPSTIEVIGTEAFNCNNLTQISPMFPASLKEIKSSAFEDCENLAGSITFPEEIAVSDRAFRNCKSLTGKLNIPAKFWSGSEMIHYHLDGSVTRRPYREIADFCFAGCSGLTGLTIADGIDEIRKCAFYGCSGMTGELVIPSAIDIDQEAFKGCSSFTKLTFKHRNAKNGEETIAKTRLEEAVFEGCSGLTGTLTMYEDDLLITGARLFYGTNFKEIHLEGQWSYHLDDSNNYLYGKDRTGTFTSRADSEYPWEDTVYENYPLRSFPEDAVIFYDDAPYRRWGYDTTAEKMRETLKKFGYQYCFYSDSTYTSPANHIVDANAPSTVLALDKIANTTYSLTPFYPYYSDPEELSRITITVADESIAEVVRYGKDNREYKFVPKKEGTTTYTVSINTYGHGVQTETGTIKVLKTKADEKKIVKGVSLNSSELEMAKGETFTLKATVSPSTAANKSVTFSSTNEAVATVTAKGLVKAVGKGEATITVATVEGGFKASCNVTVTANSYKVILDGNGADNALTAQGAATMDALDCDFNKKYTLPQNIYTKAGFVFDCWSSADPSDDEAVGIRLADKASFTDLVSKPDGADHDTDYSITLYAQWRPDKSYSVVYDGNGKKAYGATVLGVMRDTEGLAYEGEFYPASCLFTAEGCSFAGWNTKADGSGIAITNEMILSGEALSLSKDLGVAQLTKAGISKTVLYAQWTANKYTVAFDLNDEGEGTAKFADKSFGAGQLGTGQLGTGESAAENEGVYTFGTAVTKLPVAEREGYVFGGWTMVSGGTAVLKSIPATQAGDITVYAKWTPWTYSVNFDANKTQGGNKFAVSGKTAKATAKYGEELDLGANSFINKGYRFMGWSTTKDGAVPDEGLSAESLAEGGVLSWEAVAANAALRPDKNKDVVTLYAVWELSDYTLEYELCGGERNEGADNVYAAAYTYGTGLAGALPTPVRENYEFEGWFADAGFKKAVKKIDGKTFGDMVLYAKWKAQYSVVLHEGPDSSAATKTYGGYVYNKAKALPAVPYKNADKAFMGWSTSPEAAAEPEVVYTDKEKITDPELVKDEGGLTLHLYGIWRDSFTISADFDGGSYVKGEKNYIPDYYTYREVAAKAITLPAKLEKSGYKFGGWFDAVTGKKVTKISKSSCGDYDLYASWTPLSYVISFKANQPKGTKAIGKMADQKMVVGTEEDNPLTEGKFKVSGYVFIGWSTKPDSTGDRYQDGDVFGFGAGGYQKKVTLYGVWAKEQ